MNTSSETGALCRRESADLQRWFQVLECDDVTLLQAWVADWEDLTEFEIIPIVSGSRVGDAVRRVE